MYIEYQTYGKKPEEGNLCVYVPHSILLCSHFGTRIQSYNAIPMCNGHGGVIEKKFTDLCSATINTYSCLLCKAH